MKSDSPQYEKIYSILKNKIECGLLPSGSKLPSRASLCAEFGTSEKTVRRVVSLLEQDGLIDTAQRKRPTVAQRPEAGWPIGGKDALQKLQRADDAATDDLLKTGILLCYPLNKQGMLLCSGADWTTPEAIVAHMDPRQPTEFWRLSNRLWRFFIARNENELALRAVDGLGFAQVDPLPGTLAMRQQYHASLQMLLRTMQQGGPAESVPFDDLFSLYALLSDQKGAGVRRVAPDSPLCAGTAALARELCKFQERYSSVYLHLLGLIAVGRYRPGDRLPSHQQLRQQYGVSIETTIKAVRVLQDWGVVTAKRGQGIFVAMDLAALQQIPIDPQLVAVHVRRFLDALALLSLTAEAVAAHAASRVTPDESRALLRQLDSLWNDNYLYQRSPIVLLEFITAHIQYGALRAIYGVVVDCYHIGPSIPKLVNRAKSAASRGIYDLCIDAAQALAAGDGPLFAQKSSALFRHTHQLIVAECKRLGYWQAAMAVYDGSALWK